MSDAAELEREAEAARARLSETADQLKARMSPGQLMDEVLNQFRDGDGNQMLANLRTQARDNPMALALVGSGLAWLIMGSGPAAPRASGAPAGTTAYLRQASSGAHAGRSGEAGGAINAAREAAGRAWDDTSSAAGRVAESARSAGSDALGGVRDAAGSLRAAGSDALDGLRDNAASVGAAARDLRTAGEDRLAGLGHGAADLGHQARRTFADVLDREPLVIGAIGLAVGAAIGALLPASELEREHLGSTGEALRDKASTLLDRGVAAAREAAGEVYETVRDEADRQGLVPGDQPIAEKVEAVVRAAGATAGEMAEKHVAALEGDTDKRQEEASRS